MENFFLVSPYMKNRWIRHSEVRLFCPAANDDGWNEELQEWARDHDVNRAVLGLA